MESKFILTIIGLFLVSTIISVNALTCYECTDVNDGPCFDPEGQNASTRICDELVPGDYVCMKILLVNKEDKDDRLVDRSCALEEMASMTCTLYDAIAAGLADVECVSCKEDLCNSSNRFAIVSTTFVVLSLLITKLL